MQDFPIIEVYYFEVISFRGDLKQLTQTFNFQRHPGCEEAAAASMKRTTVAAGSILAKCDSFLSLFLLGDRWGKL